MNIADTMTDITKTAKTHKSNERFVRTMKIGQWFAQGDLDIVRISKKDFDTSRGKKTSERQLAPGTTKGSRHTTDGNVLVYTNKDHDALRGPVINATSRWNVRHPEHANVSLPQGYYRIDYQRDFAFEERQRVID
jgi:hypothetical protein